MARKSVDEILAALGAIVGDNTTDEYLALLEDIADSMIDPTDELEALREQLAEAELRYAENDLMHRTRYRDRFYGKIPDDEKRDETVETEVSEEKTETKGEGTKFKDVFTEVKKKEEEKN